VVDSLARSSSSPLPKPDLDFTKTQVRLWPRLCEKSVRNEAVGKLFNFPLRLAVERDEEWDCASKSGGFVSIFPTGDMTPDFSHSLGRKPTFLLGCLGG
jgi:hypothetical protein